MPKIHSQKRALFEGEIIPAFLDPETAHHTRIGTHKSRGRLLIHILDGWITLVMSVVRSFVRGVGRCVGRSLLSTTCVCVLGSE